MVLDSMTCPVEPSVVWRRGGASVTVMEMLDSPVLSWILTAIRSCTWSWMFSYVVVENSGAPTATL
jgi:hypothetical protein